MTTRLTKERRAVIRRDVDAAMERERGVPQAREMSRICEHIEDLFDELDATRAELEEAKRLALSLADQGPPMAAELQRVRAELEDANRHLAALTATANARHLEEVAARLPAKQKTTKRMAKR